MGQRLGRKGAGGTGLAAPAALLMQAKILLILDLDETLIHATADRIRGDFAFQVYHYYIYLRPGLAEFLAQCAAHFTLAVW